MTASSVCSGRSSLMAWMRFSMLDARRTLPSRKNASSVSRRARCACWSVGQRSSKSAKMAASLSGNHRVQDDRGTGGDIVELAYPFFLIDQEGLLCLQFSSAGPATELRREIGVAFAQRLLWNEPFLQRRAVPLL